MAQLLLEIVKRVRPAVHASPKEEHVLRAAHGFARLLAGHSGDARRSRKPWWQDPALRTADHPGRSAGSHPAWPRVRGPRLECPRWAWNPAKDAAPIPLGSIWQQRPPAMSP